MNEEGATQRILLIGRHGQLGWELQRTLAPLGQVIALGSEELDLGDGDGIRERLRALAPSIVVNAAAYTNVEKAEQETTLAGIVNGIAPGILAEEAKRLNAPLIHYSTDYVFDGLLADRSERPYREDDMARPLNVYGQSKLAGDRAIAAIDPAFLIFRVSWVYSTRGRNFLLAIRNKANQGEPFPVVNDQEGAPTWARVIAEATAAVLARIWLSGGTGAVAEYRGVYHLASPARTNWCGFAQSIVSLCFGDKQAGLVKPVPSSGYPTQAKRPRFTHLDGAKAYEAFGISLPHWREQLELCLNDGGAGQG